MSIEVVDISVDELKQKFDNQEPYVLIDVREAYEHQQFNLGGELIPMGDLVSKIPSLLRHKNEEIIVYCHSGNRSGWAKDLMLQQGFSNVRNLLGGILAWIEKYGDSPI